MSDDGRPLPAKGEGHGGPARGYSWAPFKAGNVAGMRHGAFSSRRVDPIAEELAAGLLEDRPDLEGYPEVVWAWARPEARCLLLAEHFADGLFDQDGAVRPGLRYVARFERQADQLRQRLGLDPRSEAELFRDRISAPRGAVDLDRLREEGRRALGFDEDDQDGQDGDESDGGGS